MEKNITWLRSTTEAVNDALTDVAGRCTVDAGFGSGS